MSITAAINEYKHYVLYYILPLPPYSVASVNETTRVFELFIISSVI
jgi:hypothetical protein